MTVPLLLLRPSGVCGVVLTVNVLQAIVFAKTHIVASVHYRRGHCSIIGVLPSAIVDRPHG